MTPNPHEIAEVQRVLFLLFGVCTGLWWSHVYEHVCAHGGWCREVQAWHLPQALHFVQLGLSITPRACKLMMIASQLSQESPVSVYRRLQCPPTFYTGFGDQSAGPHTLWQMLYSPSPPPHCPVICISTFKGHLSLAWLTQHEWHEDRHVGHAHLL